MKKFLFFLLLLAQISFSQELTYYLGMRSSKYAYIGVQPFKHWGVVYENSLFAQDMNLQYGRISLIYSFDIPFGLKGYYSFFYGMRYNNDYYDLGTVLNCEAALYSRFLWVNGVLQPRYDSDIKGMLGYSLSLKMMFFRDIGLTAGIKNLPEYRNVERRFFAGFVFETDHLKVMPEISTPLSIEMETTRVSVSFVYENSIL